MSHGIKGHAPAGKIIQFRKPAPAGIPAQPRLEHIPGHGPQCPACQAVRRNVAQPLGADMLLDQAAKIFIGQRTASEQSAERKEVSYVRANTLNDYERRRKSLDLFFCGMRLVDIGWVEMRAYQDARVAGDPPFIRRRRPHEEPGPCPCKPQQVNQEMAFLKRLKVQSACWTAEDERYYLPLQENESEVPRTLSPEEQGRWLAAARSKPDWSLIYWYSIVAFDTAASTNELRLLRLGDVNMHHRTISVPWPGAKCPSRHRTIAIENADCLWALEMLLARAAQLGSISPLDYLFPFWLQGKQRAYPDQPMTSSGLKGRWQEVREVTGLLWFRPYDTRHTAATRMAENGTPVDVIMARMGHLTERMRKHYTHISEAAQRRWMRGAAGVRREPQPERLPASGWKESSS